MVHRGCIIAVLGSTGAVLWFAGVALWSTGAATSQTPRLRTKMDRGVGWGLVTVGIKRIAAEGVYINLNVDGGTPWGEVGTPVLAGY